MERQPSMKLELKSSLEAEPRTLSNKEYELALATVRAYVNGNIEDETDALIELQVEAMNAAEINPPLPKATKDGTGPSTNTSTSTETSTRNETSTNTNTSTSSTTGTAGSGSGST